jgi:hypothetical protein
MMRRDDRSPRVDQLGFRLLVQVVWVAVIGWVVLCLAVVG